MLDQHRLPSRLRFVNAFVICNGVLGKLHVLLHPSFVRVTTRSLQRSPGH